MAVIKHKNIKTYDKLMKELDIVLSEKRISYAQFAIKIGMQTVAFYNRYKIYGFQLEDMVRFVAFAKELPPNMIKCIRCAKEFMPKAKSVKRAFCDECRAELRRKDSSADSLKFRYPSWVNSINNVEIRRLVEQEFHIDEETALQMSKAGGADEAKMIRAKRWHTPSTYYSSLFSSISSASHKEHN